MPRTRRVSASNLWALTVLSILREGPRHPYEMQRVIRLRHKDELLSLKRGSLYHAVEQLQRAGLIEPLEINREGRWPERTVYRLTDAGEGELLNWLGQLLSKPTGEPVRFMGALANIHQLTSEDATEHLQRRVVSLRAEVAALHDVVETVGSLVGRTSVLEVEYALAVRQAELGWVQSLLEDLQSGRFAWQVEELRRRFAGPLSSLAGSGVNGPPNALDEKVTTAQADGEEP